MPSTFLSAEVSCRAERLLIEFVRCRIPDPEADIEIVPTGPPRTKVIGDGRRASLRQEFRSPPGAASPRLEAVMEALLAFRARGQSGLGRVSGFPDSFLHILDETLRSSLREIFRFVATPDLEAGLPFADSPLGGICRLVSLVPVRIDLARAQFGLLLKAPSRTQAKAPSRTQAKARARALAKARSAPWTKPAPPSGVIAPIVYSCEEAVPFDGVQGGWLVTANYTRPTPLHCRLKLEVGAFLSFSTPPKAPPDENQAKLLVDLALDMSHQGVFNLAQVILKHGGFESGMAPAPY